MLEEIIHRCWKKSLTDVGRNHSRFLGREEKKKKEEERKEEEEGGFRNYSRRREEV